MRKGAVVLLAAALLVGLVAGGANAWIRSRMYDGYTPAGPSYSFAGKDLWNISIGSNEEELRSGELNGPTTPTDQRRLSWRAAMSNNTNCKADVNITLTNPDLVTSTVWYLCIGTRTGSNGASQKAPEIRIRINAGNVKIQYNNDTTLGARGWRCTEGTRTGGGVKLWGPTGSETWGVAVDNGIWHQVRLTAYTDGTWHFWVNDGTGTSELYGTMAAASGSKKINWAVPESTANAEFYTRYFYWGQGNGEIDPIPANDIGGVSATVPTSPGNTATIRWTTEKPPAQTTTSAVHYGTTFHTLDQAPVTATWVTDHWEAHLTDLDFSTAYTYYCASTDTAGQEYDSELESFRTKELALGNIVNPGFEAGCDIYPWVDIYAPNPPSTSDDTQRWGRVYSDIDGQWSVSHIRLFPVSGLAFSGTKIMSSQFREFATARQKVAVTPGKWYQATVRFQGYSTGTYTLGRIMIDPNGDPTPGQRPGSFTMDKDVWYGDSSPTSQALQTVSVVGKAVKPEISVFLQMDYDANPGKLNFLDFDDVTFQEVPGPTVTSCAKAKTQGQIGGPVDLTDVIVTAPDYSDYLVGEVVGYVEDADRSGGIRVVADLSVWPSSFDIGTEVDVAGTLELNADKELQVRARSITPALVPTGAEIAPLGMTNKAAGGGGLGLQVGVEDGVGLNNIGLVVCVWGKVTAVSEPDANSNYSIFIDDGSNLTAGLSGSTTTYPGIEVWIPQLSYVDPGMFTPDVTYVGVIGNSSTKLWDPDGNPNTNNSVQKRVIRVRSTDDVNYFIP